MSHGVMAHESWVMGHGPDLRHGSLMAHGSWPHGLMACRTVSHSGQEHFGHCVLLAVRDTVHHRLLVMVLPTTVRVDAAGKRTEGSNSLKTTSEAVNHEVVPVAVNESAGA